MNKIIKEKGITLVSLIITIIILVILSAVTIKSVFKDGFLELAAKGTENYIIAQTNEMNKLNEVDNFIKDEIDDIIKDFMAPEILLSGKIYNNKYLEPVTIMIWDKSSNTKAVNTKYIKNGEEKFLEGTNNSFIIEEDRNLWTSSIYGR